MFGPENRSWFPADSSEALASRRGRTRLGGWAWLLVKIAISLGVLYFALRRVDLTAVGEGALRLNSWWYAAALVALGGSITTAAMRWSFLTRTHAPIGPREAAAITFAAQFVGQVLPSSLGQDAVRAWLALRRERDAANTIAIIVLDRVCGLLGLSILMLAGLPLLAQAAAGLPGAEIAGLAIAFAAMAFLGSFLIRARKAPLGWPPLVRKYFDGASHAAGLLTSSTGLWAIAASIATQLLVTLSIWLIALGVGAPLTLFDGLMAIPPAVFVSLLPISINGWGVREGAMVVSLGVVGIEPSAAVLISLLYGFGLLVTSLPGVAALLLLKRTPWISPPANP